MDNKEAIIQETIKLIEEKGERLDEITVREICKRASVGLGLVNYHFGNKEKLIEDDNSYYLLCKNVIHSFFQNKVLPPLKSWNISAI